MVTGGLHYSGTVCHNSDKLGNAAFRDKNQEI